MLKKTYIIAEQKRIIPVELIAYSFIKSIAAGNLKMRLRNIPVYCF